jgi:hypothetical protein
MFSEVHFVSGTFDSRDEVIFMRPIDNIINILADHSLESTYEQDYYTHF